MEQELINKMAKAMALEHKEHIIPTWEKLAKTALAAIQEDYVLVRKEAVEIVDNDNITPHIGDLIEDYSGKLNIYDGKNLHNDECYRVYQRNNKQVVNKKDIVG